MWLSIAPIKPIPQSTMVVEHRKQQEAPTRQAIHEGKLVPTCQILNLNSVMLSQAMYFVNKSLTVGLSLAAQPNQVFTVQVEQTTLHMTPEKKGQMHRSNK